MNPTSEDCRRARRISEAKHRFVGEVGVDALPHLLPHDQKLKRALLESDRTGKWVVDTPLYAAMFACVLLGAASGLVLMAGWV